jgi:hypothetical protein
VLLDQPGQRLVATVIGINVQDPHAGYGPCRYPDIRRWPFGPRLSDFFLVVQGVSLPRGDHGMLARGLAVSAQQARADTGGHIVELDDVPPTMYVFGRH